MLLCADTAIPVSGSPRQYEVVVNPNTFLFAERAGAAAIFAATSLGPDGAIEVEFALPGDDARDTAAICEAYREFLAPRLGRPCRVENRHDLPAEDTGKHAAA